MACKENIILPTDLVPVVDNINTFDTVLPLITHTHYQDSFVTGGKIGSTRLSAASGYFTPIGTIASDPSFGKTIASTHVEVLPAVPNFSFKATSANVQIDSVVLSLPYKFSYGDTNASSIVQTFKVFRSLKTFSREDTQYEFTKDSVDHSQVLSSLTVNFDNLSTDSAFVKDRYQQPQLRFKLAPWFGDSVKAEIDKGASGALASYGAFLEWWKGFAIESDSTNGNTVGYFDTYQTRMNIYYRYPKTGGGEDTAIDVFSFDPTYCNRFATIQHNYTSAYASPFIQTNALLGDSVFFLQSEPGLSGLIKIPNLELLENVIVNKAELVFTLQNNQHWMDTITYSVIPRLQIFTCDADGNNDKIAEDYNAFGSSNYVDGKLYRVTIGGTNYIQYKFNVNYSIQKTISQKDSTFRYKIMGANTGYPSAYRTIVAGSASKELNSAPVLNLIYTKIAK